MVMSSPSFPEGGYTDGIHVAAVGAMKGYMTLPSGDVSGNALANMNRGLGLRIWEASAYLETLLLESRAQRPVVDRTETAVAALSASVDRVAGMLTDISATQAELVATQAKLVAALGLFEVPDWGSIEEVLEGDDMGAVRPSAAELGLNVRFFSVRDPSMQNPLQPPLRPEEDGPVARTEPAVGSWVRRGDTVLVFIDN